MVVKWARPIGPASWWLPGPGTTTESVWRDRKRCPAPTNCGASRRSRQDYGPADSWIAVLSPSAVDRPAVAPRVAAETAAGSDRPDTARVANDNLPEPRLP